MSESRRKVRYLPPSNDAIDAYVRSLCQQLAHDRDPAFAQGDVIHGLATFLRLASAIQASYLNREQVDNADE